SSGDVIALKERAVHLVENMRMEKTKRLRAEKMARDATEKVQMLSDHVEKLMLYLKHEATAKAKMKDQLLRMQKEINLVQSRNGAMQRKAAAKERVITELREGSKVLEDQLRLMDEKYTELRTKLDYTRKKTAKEVKSAKKESSALRVKWRLASAELGLGMNNRLLDEME
ncbi:unnamed protein product, partial [Chrysoparadoxa australica]